MAIWGEVIKVIEFTRPTLEGEIAKYYRYTLRTKKGAIITVEVPEEFNTKEQLEPIFKEKAQAQDAILGL